MAYTLIDLWDAQNPARPFASGVNTGGINTGQNTGATTGVYINGTYYPKDPRLDKERYKFTKEGGWTGDNPAWTIDSQGNIVRPAAQTGIGGTGIGYSDLGAGNTYNTVSNLGGNPFGDWESLSLQHDPKKAYYSSATGEQFAGKSPAQRRFFESKFEDIYDSYLGEMGKQVRESQGGGVSDPLFFTDYLKSDPFTERYGKLTPSERGESTARYSPRARHINY